MPIKGRVTSLKQLSLAEFSGEQVRPKVYENGHKNVLGIWFDLEWKVKYSNNSGFPSHFSMSKNRVIFLNFCVSLKSIKIGEHFLLMKYFNILYY